MEVMLPVTNSRVGGESPCDPACRYSGIVGRKNQAPPGFVRDSFRSTFYFPQAVYRLYFLLIPSCFFFVFFSPSTLCANISGWICYHLPDSWQFILYSAHSSRRKQTSRGKKTVHKNNICISSGDCVFFMSLLFFSEIANHDYGEDPLEQPPSVPAGFKVFWIRWAMAVYFYQIGKQFTSYLGQSDSNKCLMI